MAEIARGTLPPGRPGQAGDRDLPIVTRSSTASRRRRGLHRHAWPATRPRPWPTRSTSRVALADGRLLSGTVTGVRGDLLLTTTYSRVAAKHRLAAWVRLLALTASAPRAARSRRPRSAAARAAATCALRVDRPPLGDSADARLAAATSGAGGPGRPLRPRHARAAAAVLPRPRPPTPRRPRAGPGRPRGRGHRSGTTEWSFDTEDREPEHQLVLGGVLTLLEELLEIAPAAGESGDGWTRPTSRRASDGWPGGCGTAAGPRGGARPMTPSRVRAGRRSTSAGRCRPG